MSANQYLSFPVSPPHPQTLNLSYCALHHSKSWTYQYASTSGAPKCLPVWLLWGPGLIGPIRLGNALLPGVDRYI